MAPTWHPSRSTDKSCRRGARPESRLARPQLLAFVLELPQDAAQERSALLRQEDRVQVELAHRAHRARAAVAHDVELRIEHHVLDAVLLRLDRRAVLVEAEEGLDLGRRAAAQEAAILVARAFERGEVLLEL